METLFPRRGVHTWIILKCRSTQTCELEQTSSACSLIADDNGIEYIKCP